MQSNLFNSLRTDVLSLRNHFPNTNIAVGFGISDAQQAAIVAEFADGVIIGSLLVKSLEQDGLERFKILATTLTRKITPVLAAFSSVKKLL